MQTYRIQSRKRESISNIFYLHIENITRKCIRSFDALNAKTRKYIVELDFTDLSILNVKTLIGKDYLA